MTRSREFVDGMTVTAGDDGNLLLSWNCQDGPRTITLDAEFDDSQPLHCGFIDDGFEIVLPGKRFLVPAKTLCGER